MAKRFTDSEKWKDPWFRRLPVPYKALWFFIWDNCDHAGIWNPDLELAAFHIGCRIDVAKVEELFLKPRHFLVLDSGKWMIAIFLQFQYKELKESNRAHRSVLNILEREAAYGALERPYQGSLNLTEGPSIGAKDKEKDQDQDQDQDKDQVFSLFWDAYPRKQSKGQARKTWAKIRQAGVRPEIIIAGIQTSPALKRKDPTTIPHASTWLNAEGWLDDPNCESTAYAAGQEFADYGGGTKDV